MYSPLIVIGPAELEAVRASILSSWPGGIQREKVKNRNPEKADIGQPKCYNFKLNGNPFLMAGSKESATAVQRMAAQILHRYYNMGWKVLLLYMYRVMGRSRIFFNVCKIIRLRRCTY